MRFACGIPIIIVQTKNMKNKRLDIVKNKFKKNSTRIIKRGVMKHSNRNILLGQ